MTFRSPDHRITRSVIPDEGFAKDKTMPEPRNLPIDYRWKPELGVRDRNHVLKNGEYVEIEYAHKEFPKFKYHPDYVHVKEEGVEYPFTAHAQLVNSAVEEAELG